MELLHTILQNFNTKKLINIAIDRYAAVGKTSVGEAIANQYGYQFINSGLFYRHVGYYYNDYSIDQIKQIFDEEQISTNDELHDIINETIRKIVKNKGFIVVGHDITTLCLPDAEIKIILSADVETRIDTTKLTLFEIVDMILIQVFKKIL
ncbi:15793_t:CDS:2, partial [Cetraspora pellucida]